MSNSQYQAINDGDLEPSMQKLSLSRRSSHSDVFMTEKERQFLQAGKEDWFIYKSDSMKCLFGVRKAILIPPCEIEVLIVEVPAPPRIVKSSATVKEPNIITLTSPFDLSRSISLTLSLPSYHAEISSGQDQPLILLNPPKNSFLGRIEHGHNFHAKSVKSPNAFEGGYGDDDNESISDFMSRMDLTVEFLRAKTVEALRRTAHENGVVLIPGLVKIDIIIILLRCQHNCNVCGAATKDQKKINKACTSKDCKGKFSVQYQPPDLPDSL